MVALSARRPSEPAPRVVPRHPSRRGVRYIPVPTQALAILGLLMGVLSLAAVVLAVTSRLITHAAHSVPPPDSASPKPLLIIAGGAPRTGSTFVFNILRVLLRMRDPNTVASSNWMLAKLVPENSTKEMYNRIALLRTLGTSVLIKVHTAKQYYDFVGKQNQHRFADEVDVLVTGYRDLRDETVSAYKMFAKNRTEWQRPEKWADMCQALIRRRNSLIIEAGHRVPVVDIRYEDWRDGKRTELMHLVRTLAASIPWRFSEDDLCRALEETQRLRMPNGGEPEERVDWHLSNLMSPRHISEEKLSEEFVQMGVRAVVEEPKCKQWLEEKKYI